MLSCFMFDLDLRNSWMHPVYLGGQAPLRALLASN